MKKINWLDHLVNLFVVIAGISVAFYMNGWRADKEKILVENEYFRSFILDLNQDIDDLDSLLIDDSVQLEALRKLLQFNIDKDVDELGLVDSMKWAINRLASLNTFSSQNSTYESMKSSGKFEVLSDFQVKKKILDYYHTSHGTVVAVESYYVKNYDNYILPFFIEEFTGGINNSQDLISTAKFRSIVRVHLIFLSQKMDAVRTSISNAKMLREALNSKLTGS